MSEFYRNYLAVGVCLLAALLRVGAMLGVGRLVRPAPLGWPLTGVTAALAFLAAAHVILSPSVPATIIATIIAISTPVHPTLPSRSVIGPIRLSVIGTGSQTITVLVPAAAGLLG